MSAAEILVAIAQLATLFRDADGDTAFATFDVNGHRETWPVRSKSFRRWLVGKFYGVEGKPPGGQAVADALGVIEARAQFSSPVAPVHVRVAGDDECIYVDLADELWRAVKVTADGWRVVADAPVEFRRARGMLALPEPKSGGSLRELRALINITSEDEWTLLVAWLVAALRPIGPYPVFSLFGEHGTAKTTTQELLRALVDPNVAMLRAAPGDVRDVMIAATNGWVVALDNLSDLDDWLSDCLCRLATGGGFSTRELYSDNAETIFSAQRPTMLNGIESVVSRGDLLDRAIIVDLPRVPDNQRRQRRELWSAFEAARPRILGALLDGVSAALRVHRDIRLASLPRMADFAVWAYAAASAPALTISREQFLKAYDANRSTAHEVALEASVIASAVRALADKSETWSGTAAELLEALNKEADEATKRLKTWPAAPRRLAGGLRRAAPHLRAVGVAIEFTDDRTLGARRRQIIVQNGKAKDRSDRSDRSITGPGDPSGNDGNDRNDEIPSLSSPVGAPPCSRCGKESRRPGFQWCPSCFASAPR